MPTVKQQKQPAASSATVKAASTKSAEQFLDQPYTTYEVPEAVTAAPEYNTEYRDTLDQQYGQQQPADLSDSYEMPQYQSGSGEPEQKAYYEPESQKAYEPAPHDEGYEQPKIAYNPAPCPKAMTADAVEDGE